jgi:hypothetical protein
MKKSSSISEALRIAKQVKRKRYANGGTTPASLARAWTPPEEALGPEASKFVQEYPEKFGKILAGAPEKIYDVVKYPGQVLYGEKPYDPDEAVKWAVDAAGMAETGGIGGAAARTGEVVLGSGPIRLTQNNRTHQLQESAQRIKAGEGSAAEHAKLVNQFKPVRSYDAPVAPATYDEMHAALSKDKLEQLGAPRNLPEGYPAAVRLDIPAYQKNDTWVVSVHDPKTDYSAGKVIGYDSVAHLDAPTFGVQPKGAVNIAAGKPKSTIATVQGGWKPTTPEEAYALAQKVHGDPAWAQVGMDPERHAYFYNRATMEPITSAEEALHIGPLVYAKNPVVGKVEDYPFASGGNVNGALDVARKRYALGGANYGQEAYNQLLGDLEARKKLPLPTIAPLAGPSQSNTQTPDAPATPADKTPDVPAGDTTNIRRPIEGGGGGDNFAPTYQNMPTGVAPSLPSSMPETIDLTTGQPQSGKTGFGPLDRALADPVGTVGNAAFGFVPVLGPLSTVSGMFGGPTFMSLSRGAINSLSKDSQPTGAIPSNVQNLASDEVDGGDGDSPTGSGRGTTAEGLHDRAMAQYAASKGHTLGQDPNADRLAMAAMMYGETRGKGDALGAGMSAVNRSLATGQPIGAVIGKPNQYEGYSPASLQAVTNPAGIKNPIERAAAMASLQKATDLMTGKAEATHGKGTPYGNVTSFNKASPAYNYNTPSQGAVKGSAVVGEPHTFYTVNNLASPLAKAQARMEQAARAKAEQEQQAQVAHCQNFASRLLGMQVRVQRLHCAALT